MAPISLSLLKQGDATTTNAIVDTFSGDARYVAFSAAEGKQILERDAQDAEALVAGIKEAVAKGVLPADPPVEPTKVIDVLGKAVDEVCASITSTLGDAPASGTVLVLSGLSGTGKGTTVAGLGASLPRAVTWSNGNVFRSITFLALEHCATSGIEFGEAVLTPELLGDLLGKLEFKKIEGAFDTLIKVSASEVYRVSEVQNTKLKEARIGKAIPVVAKKRAAALSPCLSRWLACAALASHPGLPCAFAPCHPSIPSAPAAHFPQTMARTRARALEGVALRALSAPRIHCRFPSSYPSAHRARWAVAGPKAKSSSLPRERRRRCALMA
jgi:hypothetical protein